MQKENPPPVYLTGGIYVGLTTQTVPETSSNGTSLRSGPGMTMLQQQPPSTTASTNTTKLRRTTEDTDGTYVELEESSPVSGHSTPDARHHFEGTMRNNYPWGGVPYCPDGGLIYGTTQAYIDQQERIKEMREKAAKEAKLAAEKAAAEAAAIKAREQELLEQKLQQEQPQARSVRTKGYKVKNGIIYGR